MSFLVHSYRTRSRDTKKKKTGDRNERQRLLKVSGQTRIATARYLIPGVRSIRIAEKCSKLLTFDTTWN